MPFKNHSDPELIARGATVVQAFTPEMYAYLLSLLPTPEVIQTVHNSYAASYAAFLSGDHGKAEECEAHRSAMDQGLSILLALAKAVTVKDPKVPEILGLGAVPGRTTSPVMALSQPSGFKVTYAPDGKLVASVVKVDTARGYQVWACDGDPNLESNWRLVASSSACRGIVITGLDRAKNNWLKARAMRGKGGAGPWSNFVSLPPL